MTDSDPNSITVSNQSGGADLNAGRDITIGGDVVGRDKIVSIAGDNVAGDKIVFTGDQQYDVHGLANPYLGLQSFTYADHAKYAGREKLIAETVACLTAPDDPLALLFITGASGSGKSSFVQAGVLPALKEHYAALSVKWAVFRPSRDPLATLSDAMWGQLGLPQYDPSADFGDFLKSHTPPQQINVIVIDQFEELFTQSNAQPRDALFALLTQLPPFRATRTHIIATVRADYLPELFALPTLYDIAKRGIDLRVMSVDELREAIQQPLRVTYHDMGKRFQSELVERLAHDSAEDAAYLPLLQVTLEEIWRKGALTVGSYTDLADAIKQRADKVLEYHDYDAAQPNQRRSSEEQAAILNLCLDMVDVSLDDDVRRDVRRRRAKDELVSGVPDRARLIDTLTQARLLSVGTDSSEPPHIEVDLIHETLLSNWDRLRQAIKDRRDELQERVRFEQQLKEWIGQNRSDDYLLSGVRLAEARELESREDIVLHEAEVKDFIRRSVEREEARRQKELDDARQLAEETEARRKTEELRAQDAERAGLRLKTRNRVITSIGVIALLLAIAAGLFGIQSNQNATLAQRQGRIAFSRQLAAQSTSHMDSQFDLALLLSIESGLINDTVEARASLLTELEFRPGLTALLRTHIGGVSSVAFSPDGRTLASGSYDGTIILWDVSNRLAPVQVGVPLTGHTSAVNSVAFSPDGKTLASGSQDTTIILWDVSNLKTPIQLGAPLTGHTNAVITVAFSPDGKTLASGSPDTTIILWDVSNLKTPIQLGAPLDHVYGVSCIVFSPDGKTLASGSYDGTIILWDVSNLKTPVELGTPLSSHSPRVFGVAFSPDGKTLASASGEGTIILWDVSNPKTPVELGAPLTGSTSLVVTVYSVAFSPDGRTLASGSHDGTIILWNVSNRQAPIQLGAPLRGHSNRVSSVAFSPDGKMLASGSQDTTIILWDVSNQQAPIQLGAPLTGHISSLYSVAFDLDGKTLASGSQDATIILWDVSNRLAPIQVGVPLTGHTSAVNSVAFSPDGKTLASGSQDTTIILWDVSNLKTPIQLGAPLTGHTNAVITVAFSPDGKTLASGGRDHTIILWDISNPRLAVELGAPLRGHSNEVSSVAFSPDGKTLASGSVDGTIILWDVSNLKTPVELGAPLRGHSNEVSSVAFSPDGKTLASGSDDDTIILWDVSNPKTPKALGMPLTGHTTIVLSVAFSPDGKTLASGSGDDTIILWDVSNRLAPVKLGAPLSSHRDMVSSVAFSPDGKTLASGSFDQTIILWDVDLTSWRERACQIAHRNLTQVEWAQYLDDEPYRKTCEQWPLESEATPTSTP